MNLSGMGWNETLHKQGFVWVFKKKKNGEKIFIEGKSSETKLVSDLSKDYSSVVNSLE